MFLRDVTRRAYAALLAEPGYIDTIAPELWRGVLDGIGRIEDTTGRIEATTQETAEQLRHLTEMVAHLTRATAARASGITDDALIGLARRIAADVADPAAAFRELENAVEIAIRVQAEGRQGSNLGNFVDGVLRRVAALAAQNQYDTAAREIDAALEQEQAESTARRIRLLDAGIAQDILRRDPDSAARRLLLKADLEAGGVANVAACRSLQHEWYERGRDKGLNFDLAIAIELSTNTLPRANGSDDRGAILNDLGNALQTLGQREAGTARLEQAVAAYGAALTEWTQDRVPLNWAMTQNNLGSALRTLGRREAGTARLDRAVAAFRAALTEFTRDRVPLDWARTQNNLGNALLTLGQREAGTARLEEAEAAYRAALTERTQDRVPLDWAMTQNNLGTALLTLGEREAGTARLEEAVAAYGAALTEFTRDRVPLDWAMTQMNLGNALYLLGAREAGTERLEEALAAYRAALTERRQDRVPLDWAATLGTEGMALLTLADRTGDLGRARQALEQLTLAEATLRSGGHIPWAETFASQIPTAQALVDRLSGGPP
ncbi:MAG: tetratricopeptide repeat protein [Rhodobacter sp.]|nr:tetratricopeptide repeat protein [Rhodobacter sp.]